MTESIGKIGLDLGINYNQFNKDLNGVASTAENKVGGAFKKLGIIIAGAFAVKELANFGRESIKLASDLNEVQNVVDVTFGSMAQQVNDFSKSALASFGLSELSAKKFTSTMGAMLKSSGLSGQQMTNMSESITALSADMASFYNLNNNDAFDKIRSGISGETEPLKQLGINMNVANLEAFALTQGIKKQYMVMTQAEQTLLRYNYLMSVSKDAQGDFARTSTGWANQTRVLTEQWKIFQGTMGQGFINILAPMLTGLNALIGKLQTAALYFKAFTEMIFGAQNTAGSATVITSALGASTDDLGSAATGAGSAIKKAGKAAKGSLASFDQLNTLSKSTADAMDGMGGAGGGGTVSMPKVAPAVALPKIDTSSIMNMFKGIDFSGIVSSFDKLKTAIAPFTKTLFSGLEWLWNNVLVPFGTWTIQSAVPAFLDMLTGAFNALNPLIIAFEPLALFLWNNFLKPIAEWTGGVIVATMKDIGAALTIIGTWMSNNEGTVTTIAASVAAFFAAWKVVELLAFIQMSGGVVAALAAMTAAVWANTGAKVINAAETVYLTLLYAKDFVVSIAKGTAALATNTISWIANTAAAVAGKVALVAGTVAQWAMTAATVAWNIAAGIGAAVTTAFGVAVAILTSPVTLVIAAIAALVVGIVLLVKHWDKVSAAGKATWEAMKSAWSAASGWMETNVIKPIANMYIGLFNGIISGMNALVRGLNKIKVDIPDWVPLYGGKQFGINIPTIPSIPKLANGGLISSPTLAMVGDNRGAKVDPEVVSPLSKLQDMITKTIVEAMAAMGNNNKDDGAPIEVVLKLGETELGRAVIKAINSVHRQTGQMLLNI